MYAFEPAENVRCNNASTGLVPTANPFTPLTESGSSEGAAVTMEDESDEEWEAYDWDSGNLWRPPPIVQDAREPFATPRVRPKWPQEEKSKTLPLLRGICFIDNFFRRFLPVLSAKFGC